MKDFYLSDCPKFENQTFDTFFVVAAKQIKNKKDGAPYLALTLADRGGHIEAKMWDNCAEAIKTVDQEDFVKVRGLLNKYNGKFQFTIHKIKRVEDVEVDPADYLPKTSKDIDQLWAQLGGFINTFENAYLQRLVELFMADEEIAKAYKVAPAAKSLHHAYIGGLLDHVVSLMTLCDLVMRNYPWLNRDLVLTGVFLHDIGKIHELGYARSFSYTTKGQLLGHIVIELEMLHDKVRQIDGFPHELKMLLEHLIISHHGEYEFGSPKIPMFPEALLLHHCDNLDSKMEAMRAQFEKDAFNDSVWSAYNPSLGRTLLNTERYLAEVLKPKAAAASVAGEE
ncbi:MAG TPA: OB-fold nucleic acid binding domain-containing protein [Terriglobales bacterium]|jgi:3'-5' exoribonuclease